MAIDESILRNDEKAVFALRSLYNRHGYTKYKMSKFEEYDLYVKNKDVLVSDGVITFTDTNGRLLALKPDVTLSIINNSKDSAGSVQKVYYDENVYRISGSTHTYKEITQTGLECIGDIGLLETAEVVLLAAKSLETINSQFMLTLSHNGITEAVLAECELDKAIAKKAVELVSRKNRDDLKMLCRDNGISDDTFSKLAVLTDNYLSLESALYAIDSICTCNSAKAALGELKAVCNLLSDRGYGQNISIDFSIAGNMGYYSGIVFNGYIKGIPTAVLSGGRYDRLMQKMGRRSGAIGFAVYLDALERLDLSIKEYDVDVVLISGDNFEAALSTSEMLSSSGNSVMVCSKAPEGVTARKVIKITEKGLETVYGND